MEYLNEIVLRSWIQSNDTKTFWSTNSLQEISSIRKQNTEEDISWKVGVLKLQEAAADEIEDESWNLQTTHQNAASLALSLSLSSESAILQLQEAVADEIEDESWNFKTIHQKHCKRLYQNQNYCNFDWNFFVDNTKKN